MIDLWVIQIKKAYDPLRASARARNVDHAVETCERLGRNTRLPEPIRYIHKKFKVSFVQRAFTVPNQVKTMECIKRKVDGVC